MLAGSLSARQLLKWQVTIIVLLCLTWVACPSSQSPPAPLCDCSERESAGDSYLRMRCRRQLPKGLAVTQEINIISFQIQAAGQIRVTHIRRARGDFSQHLSPFSDFQRRARTRHNQSDGKANANIGERPRVLLKKWSAALAFFLCAS